MINYLSSIALQIDVVHSISREEHTLSNSMTPHISLFHLSVRSTFALAGDNFFEKLEISKLTLRVF